MVFKMDRLSCIAALSTALLLIGSVPQEASGEDLSLPSWSRLGEANFSTFAIWDFEVDVTPNTGGDVGPIQPSSGAILGDAHTQLDILLAGDAPTPSAFVFGNFTFTPPAGDVDGGYTFGTVGLDNPNAIVLDVPNWIDEEPLKIVRIQISYTGPAPATTVQGFVDANSFVHGDSESLISSVSGTTTDGLLNHVVDEWHLTPNPDWEAITVFTQAGTFIDQIVIDTISLPEPISLVMVAAPLAAMVLLRRRVV